MLHVQKHIVCNDMVNGTVRSAGNDKEQKNPTPPILKSYPIYSPLWIFLLVFAIAIAFAIYTNHAWEDYYITYRCSKNLATGQGLVYTPGERVHTFTSPLGVLIPALLSMVTGNMSDAFVLWLFRILSAAALALAAVFLLGVVRRLMLSRIPALFLLGMFALDVKTIDFTINGMETGILLFFVGLMLKGFLAPGRVAALELGVAFGGLMWTRPDSFVYIGSLCLGFVVFGGYSPLAEDRTGLIKVLAKAYFVAACLYLPWIIWSWHYYGSPIPHTVIAKGLNKQWAIVDLFRSFVLYPVLSVLYKGSFAALFLPPYAIGGWPYWLTFWSRALAWPSALAWSVPRLSAPYRAASLSLMLGGFYLDEINPFPYPWYLPICTLLSIFILAGALQHFSNWIGQSACSKANKTACSRILVHFPKVFVILALSMSLVLSLSAAWQLRIQQRVIEEGNRKQVGLWLAAHASSKADTVFLEPLGYIGFYSQLKMRDYPGLCSPEVVAARKKLESNRAAGLIRELKPVWLVLRAAEAARIGKNSPELLTREYALLKTFDVADRISSYSWLPGRGYLISDQTFLIFRRSEG